MGLIRVNPLWPRDAPMTFVYGSSYNLHPLHDELWASFFRKKQTPFKCRKKAVEVVVVQSTLQFLAARTMSRNSMDLFRHIYYAKAHIHTSYIAHTTIPSFLVFTARFLFPANPIFGSWKVLLQLYLPVFMSTWKWKDRGRQQVMSTFFLFFSGMQIFVDMYASRACIIPRSPRCTMSKFLFSSSFIWK